jgi:hypothetical protein
MDLFSRKKKFSFYYILFKLVYFSKKVFPLIFRLKFVKSSTSQKLQKMLRIQYIFSTKEKSPNYHFCNVLLFPLTL